MFRVNHEQDRRSGFLSSKLVIKFSINNPILSCFECENCYMSGLEKSQIICAQVQRLSYILHSQFQTKTPGKNLNCYKQSIN